MLNAANEVAVAAFLQERLRFTDIARLAENVLESCPAQPGPDLAAILEADRVAREQGARWIQEYGA